MKDGRCQLRDYVDVPDILGRAYKKPDHVNNSLEELSGYKQQNKDLSGYKQQNKEFIIFYRQFQLLHAKVQISGDLTSAVGEPAKPLSDNV